MCKYYLFYNICENPTMYWANKLEKRSISFNKIIISTKCKISFELVAFFLYFKVSDTKCKKTPATKALLALIPWTQENSTLNRNDPTGFGVETCKEHRYWKSLNRLLKVCYVPATSTVLIAFFSSFFLLQRFTVLMKQTRQPIHAIKQSNYRDV